MIGENSNVPFSGGEQLALPHIPALVFCHNMGLIADKFRLECDYPSVVLYGKTFRDDRHVSCETGLVLTEVY